ncbi:DUF192 domain-containing protein [Yunchengibacter salinarum]|uniref:DUF192 domain-containing protein n=1 Tax=Yunchengibacter salinarum TaxID=3133399 RepID=UPI0035B5D027
MSALFTRTRHLFLSAARFAALVLLAASLSGPASAPLSAAEPTPEAAIEPTPDRAVVVAGDGSRHAFTVELARDPESRAQGLMYRRSLDDGKGMLFLFPDAERRSFWMRNTYIPLDILFIRAGGRIANVVANARPRTDTPRRSRGRAVAVLEIRGGLAEELGIEAGDRVLHPYINEPGKAW